MFSLSFEIESECELSKRTRGSEIPPGLRIKTWDARVDTLCSLIGEKKRFENAPPKLPFKHGFAVFALDAKLVLTRFSKYRYRS